METISPRQARRLALIRAGLLKPDWTGLPTRAAGRGVRARRAAHAVIGRFGYLQLDTVAVAGARSHAIVLLSRLRGFDPSLAEDLLQPGEPLFEYWGHEACWLPIELYPAFEFRRRSFAEHPWWGDVIGAYPREAEDLRRRVRDEGPLRSADMEGSGGGGWWNHKVSKRVATALWSSGEFAIAERTRFQRTFDLAERVIPAHLMEAPLDEAASYRLLLERALAGQGWATTGTLAATWRLRNCRDDLDRALADLVDAGTVVPCALEDRDGKPTPGWIRPADLELGERLMTARPRHDRGVLLSPFDPVLWDRARVARLFGFDQVLEIFKPAAQRRYGYFCLPVLAGERLVARADLKAHRNDRRLAVAAAHLEPVAGRRVSSASSAVEATMAALDRYAVSVGLRLDDAAALRRDLERQAKA